jgi:hypothetical protein
VSDGVYLLGIERPRRWMFGGNGIGSGTWFGVWMGEAGLIVV